MRSTSPGSSPPCCRAAPTQRLLDSYEPERIAFARKLIDSTDRAFRIATSRSRIVGLWRRYLMPRRLRVLLATDGGSRASSSA